VPSIWKLWRGTLSAFYSNVLIWSSNIAATHRRPMWELPRGSRHVSTLAWSTTQLERRGSESMTMMVMLEACATTLIKTKSIHISHVRMIVSWSKRVWNRRIRFIMQTKSQILQLNQSARTIIHRD
jgi:hypothetical protein